MQAVWTTGTQRAERVLAGHGRRPRWPLWVVVLGSLLWLAGCASRPPSPDAMITGMAMAPERVVLPPEAVFEATLLDVSQPDAPPVVLGRQRREPAGQAPFAIAIPYPSSRFVPKGRYEVRTTVSLEGRLLQVSDTRYPVLQDRAFRQVSVQMRRMLPVPATVEASVPLALTYWRLIEVDGEAVPRRAEGAVAPHLVFQSDEPRATGTGGCNRFLIDYALRGSSLRLGAVVSGIALCLPASSLEERFFAALPTVTSYRQQGMQLLLRGAEGQPLLRFEAQEMPLQ
jgi:putative lipoprotein